MRAKIRNIITRFRGNAPAQMVAAFWVALSALMLTFAAQLLCYSYMGITPSRLITAMVFAVIEPTVLMLPFVWWKSWRYLMLPALWLLVGFYFLNQAFIRFGGEMPAFTVFTMTGNVNSDLLGSAGRLIKLTDLVYVVVAVCFSAVWCKLLGKTRRSCWLSKRIKYKVTKIIVVVFIVWQLLTALWAWYRYRNFDYAAKTTAGWLTFRYRPVGVACDVEKPHYYLDFGLTQYTIASFIELADYLSISHELTEKEQDEVKAFLNLYSESDFTEMFAGNGDKNLILIIVESLNADLVNDKIGGVEVTPTLNRLIKEEGTVSALNVVTQVRDGISSDGQMLLNTGLLPLTHGASMIRYGAINSYPSLADMLKRNDATVVFANEPNIWNKGVSFTNLGFKTILSAEDFTVSADEYGADGAMFDLILRRLPELSEPFFVEGVTMSMHYSIWPDQNLLSNDFADAGYNDEHLTFVRATQYFDRKLGKFIERLKETGLYENTIIIIASDHSLAATQPGKSMADIPTAFIALNTGTRMEIERVAGQVNLYPAILDIMEVKAAGKYRGLGSSLFDESVNGAYDALNRRVGEVDSAMIKALDISQLIINTNYFKKYGGY